MGIGLRNVLVAFVTHKEDEHQHVHAHMHHMTGMTLNDITWHCMALHTASHHIT